MASTKHTDVTVRISYINLWQKEPHQSTWMQRRWENNELELTDLLLATAIFSQVTIYLDSEASSLFLGRVTFRRFRVAQGWELPHSFPEYTLSLDPELFEFRMLPAFQHLNMWQWGLKWGLLPNAHSLSSTQCWPRNKPNGRGPALEPQLCQLRAGGINGATKPEPLQTLSFL